MLGEISEQGSGGGEEAQAAERSIWGHGDLSMLSEMLSDASTGLYDQWTRVQGRGQPNHGPRG